MFEEQGMMQDSMKPIGEKLIKAKVKEHVQKKGRSD